jgi:outer membrane lipoprotein-sorting protein
MKFLRTVSTRRLLAMIAGLVIAIAAGTTIAVAAAGTGPVPRPKPLAQALRDAANAPTIEGISARITFTNHLIDASNIQGADPLLTGATGRLWLSTTGHRLRLELQSASGEDAQVVFNNGSFWVYDPAANTVYEGKLPAQLVATHDAKDKAGSDTLPSVAQIQNFLDHLMGHANVSGAIPSDIAGHPTYTVRVSPKHDGGLLGRAELAWDASRGVPLRFAIYARGDSSPVLELKASNISYGPVPASDFSASPPAGAKVVKVTVPASGKLGKEKSRRGKKHADVTGVAAVARHVPFQLRAPAKLVGLPLQSATLLDWSGTPAALITYGQNLGGIAVIEQSAKSASGQLQSSGGHHRGLSLPTVSINGATGQELDTALGTVVRFTQSSVAYTVLGSVPPAAADAAARALG